MRREIRDPRQDFHARIERYGLHFHTLNGLPYWNESAAYVFSKDEIAELESATNELSQRCLDGAEWVIENRAYDRLHIPEKYWQAISDSWVIDPPSLYGRFDLAFNGHNPPKLLEFNADTPTSLLEAAVIQWHWLQDVQPELDQFNSIWEALVAKWRELSQEGYFSAGHVHFGCEDHAEDVMTVAVLMDTAQEAGLQTKLMNMAEIGWHEDKRLFVDAELEPIQTLFKLYPWEILLEEPFGEYALERANAMHWIEPIWKMVLSNKAILPILWELFPDHPNLLPAYLHDPREMNAYVSKPIWGREGANVTIHASSNQVQSDGEYGDQPMVFQAYEPLPEFNGNHALVGSWVIDCAAHGIGIRESDNAITNDGARFVPHYFCP